MCETVYVIGELRPTQPRDRRVVSSQEASQRRPLEQALALNTCYGGQRAFALACSLSDALHTRRASRGSASTFWATPRTKSTSHNCNAFYIIFDLLPCNARIVHSPRSMNRKKRRVVNEMRI